MKIPPSHVLTQATAPNRRATDKSLQGERDKSDELLAQKRRAANHALRENHEDAEERLEAVREEVDAHLETGAEVVPDVADTLVNVAESLSTAAANLSVVAKGLTEAASDLTDTTPVGELRQTADENAAPALADTSLDLMEQLAEISTGMAELTTNLSEEREEADEKLRKERHATDRIIDQQLQHAGVVIDDHLVAHRQLLAAERQITDRDLGEERRHTDAAVDNILDLLAQEQTAHAAAEKKFATRNEFLAIVSHDLRAPLSNMSAAAALIWRSAPDDGAGQQIRATTERLRRSVAMMERLIRDLLDFASFEDGALQVRAELQDVATLVNRSAEEFQPLAADQSLSLNVHVAGGPLLAKFDMNRMLQVLSNLLQNAIKFTPAGGSITIRAARMGAACIVAVSDTGIGIPAHDLSSIFERFRQLDPTDRAGLGLGLYISKWIVEAHGGRIWAERQEGGGTTFYFTLQGN